MNVSSILLTSYPSTLKKTKGKKPQTNRSYSSQQPKKLRRSQIWSKTRLGTEHNPGLATSGGLVSPEPSHTSTITVIILQSRCRRGSGSSFTCEFVCVWIFSHSQSSICGPADTTAPAKQTPAQDPRAVSLSLSPKGSKNKEQSFLFSVCGSVTAKQEPASTRAASHHHTPAPAHPAPQ